MLEQPKQVTNHYERRAFIGDSNTPIIMGANEPVLPGLSREESREIEPEELSANLIVQPSLVE